LPNLLGILIVVLVSFRLGFIPFWLALLLGIFAFTPFFLNDFLFPASYMPDQFKYLHIVQSLRVGSLSYEPIAKTVELAGWFLAFVPLPFVETIYSLGFYNRFIVTILIIWLYSSKHLRGWPLLFILFYPSFLLYSSLALRDTLIFVFMLVSVILFIENHRILAMLVALPLLIIKFQNFFLILVFFVVYLTFTKGSFFYQLRFIILPLVLVALIPFLMQIIEVLDFYRLAMFIEDGGDRDFYVPIGSISDFLVIGFQSAPYFLLKPFPWEASGLLQLMQSFENFLVFIFLAYLFWRVSKIDRLMALKWLVFLLFALTIYGLVVFNYGTAVRYKFPFILIVVIGMAYDLYLKHGACILRNRQ
ncbi:MAG: hypothetical protein IE909_17500, partial [Campylobacterales bacterium]|nr:hypothetical protein [Campylobacterales bacterium]